MEWSLHCEKTPITSSTFRSLTRPALDQKVKPIQFEPCVQVNFLSHCNGIASTLFSLLTANFYISFFSFFWHQALCQNSNRVTRLFNVSWIWNGSNFPPLCNQVISCKWYMIDIFVYYLLNGTITFFDVFLCTYIRNALHGNYGVLP